MPFNFKAYDEKCSGFSPEELQREWQHYTRLITGAATSTSVSGLALPLTLGISGIGIAMSAPAIHNARKKRAIIERHLARHNERHVTRKRDVIGSMTISGAIGVATLGASSFGADAIAVQGAEHGISSIIENGTTVKVATHAAMDGVGMAVEHMHTDHIKKRETAKAFKDAGVFQAVADAKAAEASGQTAYNPQNLAVAGGSGSNRSSLSLPSSPPPSYNQAEQAGGYYIQYQAVDDKMLSFMVSQDAQEDYLPPPYPPLPSRPSSTIPQYQGNKGEQWYASPYQHSQGMYPIYYSQT